MVISELPELGDNFSTNNVLGQLDNIKDLVKTVHFPVLFKKRLHLIIGMNDVKLISFDVIHEPSYENEPKIAHCKLGMGKIKIYAFPLFCVVILCD